MAVTIDREPVRAAPPVRSEGATGRGIRAVVGIGGGVVLLHALEGLVLFPLGDPSIAVRMLRLAAITAVATAVAVAWTRSSSRAIRGLLELLVGVVGVLSGGVATVPRLGDLPAPHAITGVLATLAGLLLTGIGFAHLVASIRSRWRRVVAVPLGLLALLYLLAPLGMAVLVTNRARSALGERTPADVGLRYEEVRIPTTGGVVLRAWYVPSANGAAVLALPGSGSTRDDVLDHAAMLAVHGYGVLMVDVPGHGGSGGEPMELGWGGERYLRPAVGYLESRPDVTAGIGVLGLSMGGEQGLTLAAFDPRIAAVVAEGASVRTHEDALRLPHPALTRVLGSASSWLNTFVTDLLADATPPMPLEEAVRMTAPRPLLLISAGTGQERDANRVYAEAAGERAERWELPDAPHIGGLRADPQGYEGRVIALFDAALLD
jgi:pimeloyl-ACP methyl ester carboxylesterase